MIDCLYEPFQKWALKGSVYIISDTHFDDSDCKLMDKDWISPEEHVKLLNGIITKTDTLVILGDIGNTEWAKKLRGYKVLVMGNHDSGASNYKNSPFQEVYSGPLMISDRIILSHEPLDVPFTNVHGHNHAGAMRYKNRYGFNCLNLASNVCNYRPINLGKEIKNGLLSDTLSVHRMTIDYARENPIPKEKEK